MEQMYSSTLSLTSALDSGGWLTPGAGRFTSGNDAVPIVKVAGWAPGLVRKGSRRISPSLGFDPRTVQSVGSRYTDKAIPAHIIIIIIIIIIIGIIIIIIIIIITE